MTDSWSLRQYARLYQEPGLERRGLFRLLFRKFGSLEVLYPASSIHVTPSFYTPRVVYVDHSELSARFFADASAVTELVNREKTYRAKPQFRFLRSDINKDLPLRTDSFDLLISINSGAVVSGTFRFLKAGGIFLTSEEFGETTQLDLHRISPEFTIRGMGNKYMIEGAAEDAGATKKRPRLVRQGEHLIFSDNQRYFVYRITPTLKRRLTST